MTLWKLPAALEEAFDARWEHWLDSGDGWRPFFQQVEQIQGTDLPVALKAANLIGDVEVGSLAKLRRSAEGRAVPIPGTHQPNDALLTLLALGFARGEVAAPAIPYARLDD